MAILQGNVILPDGSVLPPGALPAQGLPPPRSALGEIGTGLARGAMVDLPQMAGQTLKAFGAPGIGQSIVESAQARAAQPQYQLQPGQHNAVTNAIAGGAAMLPAVAGLGALGLVPGGEVAAPVAAGALFGGSTYQDTYEQAKAAGATDDAAHAAALKSGAIMGLGGLALSGIAKGALGGLVPAAAPAAETAADAFAAPAVQAAKGAFVPALKSAGLTAAELTGVNAAQQAGVAYVNQGVGIKGPDPLAAAIDSVAPSLGLSLFLGPFAAFHTRAAQAKLNSDIGALTDTTVDPTARMRAVNDLAPNIAAAPPKGADPTAWTQQVQQWRSDALAAANAGEMIDMSPAFSSEWAGKQTALQAAATNQAYLDQFHQGIQAVVPPEGTEQPGPMPQNPVESFLSSQSTPEADIARQQRAFPAEPAENSAPAETSPMPGLPEPTPESRVADTLSDLAAQDQVAKANAPLPALPNDDFLTGITKALAGVAADAKAGRIAEAKQSMADAFDAHTQTAGLELKGQARGKAKIALDAAAQETTPQAQVASLEASRDALPKTSRSTRDALDSFITTLKGEPNESTSPDGQGAEPGSAANETGAAAAGRAQAGNEGAHPAESYVADDAAAEGTPGRAAQAVPAEGLEKPTKQAQAKAAKEQAAIERLAPVTRQEAARAAKAQKPKSEPPQDAAGRRGPPQDAAGRREPPQDAAKAAPGTEDRPVITKAKAALDKLTNLKAKFEERIKARETNKTQPRMTELEQRRYEDVQSLHKAISELTDKRSAAHDAYLSDLLDFAKQTERPYTKADLEFSGDPNKPSIAMTRALQAHDNVHGLLGELAKNSTTPWVRSLSRALLPMKLDSRIEHVAELPGNKKLGVQGTANLSKRMVSIKLGGESEHVVLHEIVHVATAKMVELAKSITTPRSQRQVALKNAYARLEEIRENLLAQGYQPAGETYGLKNAHEFVAELNTSRAFQDLLRANGDGPTSIWQKVLGAIDGLLGTRLGKNKSYLDEALSLQGEYFKRVEGAPEVGSHIDAVHEFNASTSGAAKVIDDGLSKAIGKVVTAAKSAKFDELGNKGSRTLLYLSSVHHIHNMVDRVEAFKHGIAESVGKFVEANRTQQQVGETTAAAANTFGTRLLRAAADLKGADRKTVPAEMGAIGKMASAFNVDPAKNFADNLKLNKQLDPARKAIIDELHGRYASLLKSHPEFAKAIKQGEQLGRKLFIQRMATLARTILHTDRGSIEEREQRVQDAQDKLNEAVAAGKGEEAALKEHAEAVAALAHAKDIANLLTRHDMALDINDKDLAKAKNANPAMHVDGASSEMALRLERLFGDVAKLPADNPLRAQMAQVSAGYHAQVDNPYLHLGRQGGYFTEVKVKPLNAQEKARLDAAFAKHGVVAADLGRTQDHSFSKFDTYEQAVAFHRAVEEAIGKSQIISSSYGQLSRNHTLDNRAGVNAALRQLSGDMNDTFADVPGLTAEQRTQIMDSFTDQLMELLPETSASKATMIRQGTPGYDAEFLQSFARRANEVSRQIASNYTMRDYTGLFRDLQTQTDALGEAKSEMQPKAQQITDELGRRHADSMQPNGSGIVNTINNFGFNYYLGVSPAFVIRNAMQIWHLGLPVIGGRYGFVKTAKALGVAAGDTYKFLNATIKQGLAGDDWREVLSNPLKFDGLGFHPAAEDFLHQMVDKGIIMSGQTNTLHHLTSPTVNAKVRDAVRAASMFADYSEKYNRGAAGLAAFRLAGGELPDAPGGEGQNAARAAKYAFDVVEDTMINYEQHNTGRALGSHGVLGSLTPLISQFAKYNFGVLEMVHKLTHDAILSQHDGTPEGIAAAKKTAAEARKTLAGLAATTTLFAGVMGLPFVSAFAGLYNLFSDRNNPSDVRVSVQNFLADVFGTRGGEILSRGVPRALGIDFSPIGLQDILPGSGFLADRQLMKDKLSTQAQEMLGPALNGGMNIAAGMQKMVDGYYLKALEQILPTALKNLAKASDIAVNGFTDSKGNPIAAQATPLDVLVQTFGLRPGVKATSDEANQAFNEDQALLQHRRGVITDHLFKAYRDQDEGALAKWEAERTDFNQKNPTQPIRKMDVFRASARGLAVANMNATGIKSSGKLLGTNAERYRFANINQ